MSGKRQVKQRKSVGFTNKLGLYVLLIIFITIVMGFYLAVESIKHDYVGSLVCFTAAIAPLDAALTIVLGKIVDKNKAENIGGNGDGIIFAKAKAKGFEEQIKNSCENDINSPAI